MGRYRSVPGIRELVKELTKRLILDNKFDGDQLNCTLSMDGMIAAELSNLDAHKSTYGLDEPWVVTSNLSMSKPVIATISYYMASPLEYDANKQAMMDSLLTEV